MAFVPFTETDQPTMAAFNEKFQACIADAVDAGVKIETGSYVGTGTYGADNPNSLTFAGVPKLVFIFEQDMSNVRYGYYIIAAPPMETALSVRSAGGDATGTFVYLTWSDKNMEWDSSVTERTQLNENGKTYLYVAFL